jgi:hypothetical protein
MYGRQNLISHLIRIFSLADLKPAHFVSIVQNQRDKFIHHLQRICRNPIAKNMPGECVEATESNDGSNKEGIS